MGRGRRLGFDYHFEVFVPEAKRQYGYYVMSTLDGDRLVGRVDPQFQLGRGVLAIRCAGIKASIACFSSAQAGLSGAIRCSLTSE